MREAPLPPAQVPAFERSVAACVAAILEIDTAAVPLPPAGHPRPWTVWREWLAEQGLGLVPVHDPAHFNFGGPWIAVLLAAAASSAWPSPPGWRGRWRRASRSRRARAAGSRATATSPERARSRTRTASGTTSRWSRRRRSRPSPRPAAPLSRPEDARRNVVTRGIDLDTLIGRRFRVGEAECVGRRRCEPCAHLERLTVPGVLRGLVHRGGLRADVVADGEIRLGDEVAPV